MSSPASGKRIRDVHGASTRATILEAARAVFSEVGFASTSVKSLAERAGVAVQTIYDTFGSKGGVLAAMVDLLDRESGVTELFPQMMTETDPARLLGINARARRQIRERCGDITHMLRAGAAIDPEVAAIWAEGMRRRRFGAQTMAQRLHGLGALKKGLTTARAADMISAIVVDEVCDVLVEQLGWSFDEYEAFVTDLLTTTLLREPPRRPAAARRRG